MTNMGSMPMGFVLRDAKKLHIHPLAEVRISERRCVLNWTR